jgi:pyruvate dehydrogenase E2 component (dihydrolipoamide acetyltransferase)
MANPVIMPRQGQSVESCIISSWNKKTGEPVKKGEVLFSYETDKAAFEYEAESEGILLKRLFEEGDEVPVLQLVAIIGQPGEALDQFSDLAGDKKSENTILETTVTEEASPVSLPAQESRSQATGDKIRISPRARARAQFLGISFAGIEGSGPAGRIMEADIDRAARSGSRATPLAQEVARESGKAFPGGGTGIGGRVTGQDVLTGSRVTGDEFETRKLSNMRKIIAARMHQSLQNSAQLTHHTSADARRMLDYRKKAKEAYESGKGENITLNDMVCYAVVRALKKHPMGNAHFLGDSMRVFSKVHLGIAVDTERGLMVPTVKNADDMTITALARQLKNVAGSCKKGNIDPELLTSESATFSVSNLGSYGVELFTPVINLPQVAILGVNTIISRPADLGGGVFGFVPYIGLSLTYDHRGLDGAPASALLREIRLEIENLELTF